MFFATQSYSANVRKIAQPDPRFKLEQLARCLGVPWGLAFVDATRLMFTERGGGIGILDLNTLRITRVEGAPKVIADDQGGLLDVAIGPNYKTGGWIYFTYSEPASRRAVPTLARAKLEGARLQQWQDLLVSDSASDTSRHFGSRITFDDDGHVFFSIGDRGEAFVSWRGNLFADALKLRHLNRIVLPVDGQAIDEERQLEDFGERIRALATSPEGWIYLSTDSGQILRMRPVE